MNATSRDPSAVLQREYNGDLATLRAARRDVVAWLRELGADDETNERAALIVSELTSNAIQAAPGRTYSVLVTRLDDGSATISVRNHSIEAARRRASCGDPRPRHQCANCRRGDVGWPSSTRWPKR